MKDPLISDQIVIAGCNYPLAADLSIGPAALLAKDRPQRLGFIRMIRPAKYAYTARLVRLQPYNRNKIPVLMIHGLHDTPATWAPLLNELRNDPRINHQYQSERIVSSHHGAHQNKQGMEEVHRILIKNTK